TYLQKAATLNNLGQLVQETQPGQALTRLDEAIECLGAIRMPNRQEMDRRDRQLAINRRNRALLLLRLNRPAEAWIEFEAATHHLRDLTVRNPQVSVYSEELAIAYNDFGLGLFQQGDHDRSRRAFLNARSVLSLLVDRRPDEPRYRSSIAGVNRNLERCSVLLNQWVN
ncbi:MAG: hypothetical protein AAGA03_03715, partial [Planctomycetota bacterium]